jgi:RTX calcium-binding nonapeptide repeat (4 copies)
LKSSLNPSIGQCYKNKQSHYFIYSSCYLFLAIGIILISNIHASYAQPSATSNPLESLIPSTPTAIGTADLSDSLSSSRINEIANIIDKPGSTNFQLCMARNINSGSITSQVGRTHCNLSNEDRDSMSSLSLESLLFCPSAILLPIPCIGTEDDDIIYGARTTEEIFALAGNDMVFANSADSKIFGGKDDDLLVAGPGNDLVDGGPNNDVLLAGAGSDLLAGGKGNDKLFNGAGTAVMYGGKGANHFDCSLSALGLARSVVMDYNPSKGDTIAGPCKIINNLSSQSPDIPKGLPKDTLPDTGETSSNNEIIAGALAGG